MTTAEADPPEPPLSTADAYALLNLVSPQSPVARQVIWTAGRYTTAQSDARDDAGRAAPD